MGAEMVATKMAAAGVLAVIQELAEMAHHTTMREATEMAAAAEEGVGAVIRLFAYVV
jgi:hypothetical protein